MGREGYQHFASNKLKVGISMQVNVQKNTMLGFPARTCRTSSSGELQLAGDMHLPTASCARFTSYLSHLPTASYAHFTLYMSHLPTASYAHFTSYMSNLPTAIHSKEYSVRWSYASLTPALNFLSIHTRINELPVPHGQRTII